MTDRFVELAGARDEVLAEAESFRLELEPILAASLRAGLRRLWSAQGGHRDALEGSTLRALDETVDRAVDAAVSVVSDRLRDPELWLSPHTAPDLAAASAPGWPLSVPAWLAGMLRAGERQTTGLGDLDDPSNRIWVAIASAAGPIDAVLQEFDFTPQRKRIGGGRFGVVPRTLPRLDPSGVLQRRWKRFRIAFARFETLSRASG